MMTSYDMYEADKQNKKKALLASEVGLGLNGLCGSRRLWVCTTRPEVGHGGGDKWVEQHSFARNSKE
jgi:hypothetical protein